MYRTLRMLVAATVMSAAAVVVVAGPAHAAAVPTRDASTYSVSTSYSTAAADALGGQIGWGKNRTVDWVMQYANRPLEPIGCQTQRNAALHHLSIAASLDYGFCWEDTTSTTDDPDGAWYPQGITSTADAYAADYYDGVQAVAVTWYHKTAGYARLSLAPIYGYGTGTNKYRHLLFATPTSDGYDFSKVPCHAGGAMWYGDLLYVACSDHIKLFSFKHIFSADTSADCASEIGRKWINQAWKFCASGYAYIMLQVGRITSSNVHFSSISLDREATPDKLVVSEYSTSVGARLWRFNLNSSTRLPASAYNFDAWKMPFDKVQGATTRDTKFWFHSSGGVMNDDNDVIDNFYGTLRFWDGQSTSPVRSWTGAYGAESLSYFGDNSSMPDTIFTLSEHPGYRGVIAFSAADFQ